MCQVVDPVYISGRLPAEVRLSSLRALECTVIGDKSSMVVFVEYQGYHFALLSIAKDSWLLSVLDIFVIVVKTNQLAKA